MLAAAATVTAAVADADAQGIAPGSQYSSASAGAMAQSMGELLAAGSRQASQGIRIGAFTLLPSAATSIVYDDNVFAQPANERGDRYTNVDAEVAVISNWSRHALELYAGGGGNFYDDFTSEDKGYAKAGVSGRVDVRSDLWLVLYAKYAFGFEARGAGESFQALGASFAEPIETQTFGGGVLIHKAFNRLWLEIAGSGRRQTYFDAKLTGGGTADQSFRDGTVEDAVARAGYEFSPRTSAFLESVYEKRDFEDNRFDSDGYRLLAGVRYELTRLINAEIAVGYMHHDTTGSLNDIDTWTFRTQVRYEVTPLFTAAVVGARDAGAPSQFGTGSNRVETEIGVRGDYAIRRDVMLTAGAGLGWVDYVDATREDEYWRLTTGVAYQMRPWLSLWANYSYLNYDANVAPTIDYEKSLLFAGLSAQY
jgi:hypothetical protein